MSPLAAIRSTTQPKPKLAQARRKAAERDCLIGAKFDIAISTEIIGIVSKSASIVGKMHGARKRSPHKETGAIHGTVLRVGETSSGRPDAPRDDHSCGHDKMRDVARITSECMTMSEELANVALAAPGVLGVFFLGPNGHVAYRYVSPKSEAIFGLAADAICADPALLFKRLHKTDLDALNAKLFQSAQDMTPYIVEFRFDHPKKGLVWLEAQAAPVRDPQTGVLWYGYASDITARKLSELTLAETAALLQATIDGAQDAIMTMDGKGYIQSVNSASAAMFDSAAEAMIGSMIESIVESANLSELLAGAWSNAHRDRAAGAAERITARGLRRDRSSFPVELSLSDVKFDGCRLLVVFIKDLSRQRMIEKRVEELRHNRLDAMGGMAATLAHEINQPLAATATYLKVARRMLEKSSEGEDQEVMDVLDKAAVQTLRAGRIVTSLRDLMQRGEPDKTLVQVNGLIRETCDSIHGEGRASGIKIQLAFEARRDQVVADRAQLRQVLGNLIRNAIDAMSSAEKRELLVSTDNPDEATIRIEVRDSGCGLGTFAQEDCFEPFTSTKAKGLGIGLSISRSIIEAHYGRIWAKSNTNGGTVFSFTLPLQDTDVDL